MGSLERDKVIEIEQQEQEEEKEGENGEEPRIGNFVRKANSPDLDLFFCVFL